MPTVQTEGLLLLPVVVGLKLGQRAWILRCHHCGCTGPAAASGQGINWPLEVTFKPLLGRYSSTPANGCGAGMGDNPSFCSNFWSPLPLVMGLPIKFLLMLLSFFAFPFPFFSRPLPPPPLLLPLLPPPPVFHGCT